MIGNGAMRRTLVISDNPRIAKSLRAQVEANALQSIVELCRSPRTHPDLEGDPHYRAVCVKSDLLWILEQFQLVVSAHCKQIFPGALHERVECVNVHPGFNPETRGWYPQVWSILHRLPLGFTIHRIDSKLDHGDIIYREELPLHAWDTSQSAYDRVLSAEVDWLKNNLSALLSGDYTCRPIDGLGRLFLRKDFESLCELNLKTEARFGEMLDLLRALSFSGFRNAWFRDPVTGKRVFVRVDLEVED